MKAYTYKGRLAHNHSNDRYGILSNMDLWVNDGLHCGACFEVKVNDKWVQTRIEYGRRADGFDDWYLVGLPDIELEQLLVRM